MIKTLLRIIAQDIVICSPHSPRDYYLFSAFLYCKSLLVQPVIMLKEVVDLESLLQQDIICSSKNLALCPCLLDHRQEPYIHCTVDFSRFGKNGHAVSDKGHLTTVAVLIVANGWRIITMFWFCIWHFIQAFFCLILKQPCSLLTFIVPLLILWNFCNTPNS